MWGFWFIVILVVMLIATLPAYRYSQDWGYFPAGIVGIVLLSLSLLMWLRVIVVSWPWSTTQ